MKSRSTFASIIFLVFFVTSCSPQEDTNTIDLINDEFPEAQQDAYGPKFTEFKNGEPRNGGVANEAHERNVFGSVTNVVKFDAKDLKIAVYGDVANLTFHSDFQLMFEEDLVVVNDQITLLFVKTDNGWKMVHEHHSPLNK